MKLYHSSPYEIKGGVLNPTTKNIAVATNTEGQPIATFTEYADANIPYVFATDNFQLSMTYTISKDFRLANLHGLGGTEILFLMPESFVGDPELKGGIYSFETNSFVQAYYDGKATDQWVSDREIDLRDAEFTPIRNLNDILMSGVQIYQLSEREDYQHQDFHKEIAPYNDALILSRINGLIDEGKLRWLNQERGINPVNFLEEKQRPVLSVAAKPQTLDLT